MKAKSGKFAVFFQNYRKISGNRRKIFGKNKKKHIKNITNIRNKKMIQKTYIKTIIKQYLKPIEKHIAHALLYGSSIDGGANQDSDIDLLIILKKATPEIIYKIRDIRQKLQTALLMPIDINAHSVDELPSKRGLCFWHHNREYYVQAEFSKFATPVLGSNPFTANIKQEDISLEAVKMLNSYVYQLRKLMINTTESIAEQRKAANLCIYACQYALAAKGMWPLSKEEATKKIHTQFVLSKPGTYFLKYKKTNKFGPEIIPKAYQFLQELDKQVFQLYEGKQ
ncbi:MAG: nucleotidyltransferase domain-containing protein [Candidatus Woesearchaeota archaeon]